jgi:threonine dehydrogenase-like Zn-dependent dehydrogenase
LPKRGRDRVRELQLIRSGKLAWSEREAPVLREPTDAIVRPFVAGRCDGDTLPIHHRVSRLLQAGLAARVVDPAIGCICGAVPFKGPFAIGHEGVARVLAVGADVEGVRAGETVVVPWAVSCGTCDPCRRGLTSKCATTTTRTLAAYGFGPATGSWGGMVSDALRVPFADHMLVPVPPDVPPLRVAAAGDNLADAWRSVVTPLRERPGGSVLVIGGGAKSIGLYAAGLAAAHDAGVVHYLDDDPARRAIAEALGAQTRPLGARSRRPTARYDVVVEASSRAAGLRRAIRSLAPGGVCTAVGYYLGTGTRVPVMHMYATDAALRVGVSHARATLPELLAFIARSGFPAEQVTTLTADWDDAPTAYAARTTKFVLQRDAGG